jgi:hypothetical protein
MLCCRRHFALLPRLLGVWEMNPNLSSQGLAGLVGTAARAPSSRRLPSWLAEGRHAFCRKVRSAMGK